MRVRLLLPAFSLLGACAAGESLPGWDARPATARIGQAVRLAAGRSASLPEAGLLVTFTGVGADSRCPAGVVCVWQGDAAVELRVVARAEEVPVRLHTGKEPRAAAVAGHQVRLVGLEPAPRPGEPIPPARYVATLRVERLAGDG